MMKDTTERTWTNARNFAAAAACAGLVVTVGCSSPGEAEPGDEVAMMEVENAGMFKGVPSDVVTSIESTLEDGSEITGIDVLTAETGEPIYEVTYIIDGDAEQSMFRRDGGRMAVYEPTIGDEQPGPGLGGPNIDGPSTQPIDQ